MLDAILGTVKNELIGQMTGKTELNADQARQSADVAKDTVVDQVQKEAMSGNISGLLDVFNGRQTSASNSIIESIGSQFVGRLIEKVGLPPNIARQVSQMAIPFIMSRLVQQTPENMDEKQLAENVGGDVLKSLGDKLKGGLGGLFGG